MNRRRRLLLLLAVLFVVVGGKLGVQLFRWYAYAEERARLGAVTHRLEDSGFEVVRTQLTADSLREQIERADSQLYAARRGVSIYDKYAVGGSLPTHLYDTYRAELDEYNRHVGDRNRWFEEWKEVVARNHRAVESYNARVDTMRALAAEIGEPYISIPTPAEIASRRGLSRGGG